MKIQKVLLSMALTFGLCLTACEKEENLLNKSNPNAQTQENFWKTEADAINGINATYANIQNRTITLWEVFHYDMRSDEGYSQSPWTELANVGKFIINDYNVPFVREMYTDVYRTIYRSNQVLTFVPEIEMNERLKSRILAEAKFIRAHMYFKLVTLWGGVPIVTTIQLPTDRPAQATETEVWAQIEKDFTEAKADLWAKEEYTGNDIGRVSKEGATAYLGRVYLQQKKYAEAAAQFKEIIDLTPGKFDLMPNFKDNFTEEFENNKESLFEIQFTNNNGKVSGFPVYDAAGGDETSERAQFFGVRTSDFPAPEVVGGWCDGQPTKWLLNQFLIEKDKNGNVDPRLQYTLYYKHPGELLFGKTYEERKIDENQRFWKKYTNYYKTTEGYFSGINTREIRLADVYLMYAEALNELGRTAEAIPFANLVRLRSNMNELPLSMAQTEFRERLRQDRVLELAGESKRFLDMKRYGILGPELAGPNPDLPPNVADFDTEFKNFVKGKSEYLPIPLYEIDALGPEKIKQNPGY
ncbi:RagB/SusD family nutrient uptake outer membrane protein [Rhodocytophaga aerolata]|uniref:RagB/SusD family nutrient uptake outer membrane protein n=1 Tax=Rhodocytophaga aerolata TaxID=455078 RepID=A0ABT8RED1_9BACT|nr:RagB/SusD family nutrient uptake outer membrane protein [Rhodocytophaga aerolata]MDO1450481.1 RagB/SusD family nutrient uptake outer membrane protein [Rhodocytophaga aerolata]